MQIKNSKNDYGVIAIILHWVMAILLIALLGFGIYMVDLPVGLEKLKLYGWHKEYGLLALFLVISRLSWRLGNILPRLDIPLWEIITARTVHWIFYAFMFAVPITGWLITSAAGLPASFFGLFVLPNLIAPNPHLVESFEAIHKWLSYGLIATLCLHVCAALKHHFIDKDNVLRRMLS